MLAYVLMYVWKRKIDTNDANARAHLQRSEQTLSLFCNKSACSSVGEANFEDHRAREDLLSLWKHPKAESQAK